MDTIKHKVINLEFVSDGYFYINFERNGLTFKAGEYLNIGLDGDTRLRKYSIASGEQEDILTLLIKVIPGGLVSTGLSKLQSGDYIEVSPAFGDFAIKKNQLKLDKIFVATGTGLAPFRSYIKTYPEIPYKLVHGVRTKDDIAMSKDFDSSKTVFCITNSDEHFDGRVTKYLKNCDIDKESLFYVCGSCEMIYDVYDVLQDREFPVKQVITEVYYV